MADPWQVVGETPAPEFEQRWEPVEESSPDPWTPVKQETLTGATKPPEQSILGRIHEAIQPEPIIGGVGATAISALRSLLSLPERAIEASKRDVRQMGSGELIEAVEPAAEAAMATMPFRKTVGGVRAHPTEAAAAAPETIRSAAIRHGGKTYEGPLHADAYQTAADATGQEFGTVIGKTKPEDAGFVTSTGRYVSRDEAAKLIGYEGKSELAAEMFPEGELKAPKTPEADPLAPPPPSPEQMGAAKSAARTIKNLLNPDEVSPLAESAAADIRAAGGKAARDTETTRAALDAEMGRIANMDDAQRLGLIDYIETRSKGAELADPSLKPLADTLGEELFKRREKIEELPSVDKMTFVDDYYPHMWKNPAKAESFIRDFERGTHAVRQGSGASLKKRTIPTVADGIKAGLEPITTDPIETTIRYVQSMDRFIAAQSVLDKAKAEGNVRYYRPTVVGASGHPESFQGIPEGWVPINGRGSTNAVGAKAYAPADWARIYNNYIDPGFHRTADVGKVYDVVRNTSNAITSLELGISGFHAATMAQEAMVNAVARGIGELASGKPIKAAKSIGKAPLSPILDTLKGREVEHVYLSKKQGTALTRQITDLLTEAGGRAKGARHAPDYQYTAAGSYWDTFKRGTALMEAKALGREFKEAPLKTAAVLPFRTVGRVLQTVAKPLFEYTIPKMKNGAFYDNMASWLEANPNATRPEQLKAARKIWDSIDNRFGETVQDNIFWNKTLKQSLQVALRSYSWTFGTIQEIGGGAKDLLRHPTSLSPKSQHYSPKSAYVIALPIVYATLNAVYQKLKTGKDPESIQDVMRGGLTGGTAPGVGGRGEVPERAMMPGYMKDVFGWYHHPYQEAKNKMSTGLRMVGETLSNKDWKDQPIRNRNDPTPDQVRQYFEYVLRSLGPISIKQLAKGQKEGSNITAGEAMLGLRPTPQFLQDPEGYERMTKGIGQRDWQRKERYEKRQEKQYGGPQ